MRKETAPTTSTHNVLTSKTIIKGEIYTEEDFRVDGAIEGNITCFGKIVIGHNSVVTGNIKCSNVELFGQINGNIHCTDTIVLRSPSLLKGDIKTKMIEIEPGAQFIGYCYMLNDSQTEEDSTTNEDLNK